MQHLEAKANMHLLDFLNELPRLQQEQAAHDSRAHQQVLGWDSDKRLEHYTLHFGKYLPSLVRENAFTPRIGADSLIVTLAMANVLGVELSDLFRQEQHDECVGDRLPKDLFFETYSHMCKLAESAQHGEPLPYREEWPQLVTAWLHGLLWHVEHVPYDMADQIRKRWRDVEQNSSSA